MSTRSVTGANGKPCAEVKGSCSCCGAESHPDRGQGAWYMYRAGWCDSDGVYMARLCGDFYGSGCISEVSPGESERAQERTLRAKIMLDMMPEEADDGIQTEMEDIR